MTVFPKSRLFPQPARAVQRLSSATRQAESRPGRIGPINLDVKQMGERSAGNPHAAFDAAGAGNVARSRWCDTRRRKSEPTGNTNFDLNRRASPRPYVCPVKAGMFSREQTCRGRSQSPVVWIAEEMETEPSKPIDKTSRGEVTSHRAVTTVNALWPRK